ncbi:hypothetical protein GFL09_15225 [Pseudomonas stutzeri]|uniref:hypothetical protein n=1 Tax=Stutzerimonas stutzeri TaxID=316 RepID=UPI00190BA006|nr:hypothetical protein [Stutzerimonas stutzeri]MBK3869020.1 hypothetical protein [Stutzerimonas stutzeri]
MRGSFRLAEIPGARGVPGEVGSAGASLYGESALLSSAARTTVDTVAATRKIGLPMVAALELDYSFGSRIVRRATYTSRLALGAVQRE